MQFRLIIDDALDGATNMAIDEALLVGSASDGALPTLRLYRFRRRTMTFGYGQRAETAVDWQACRELGVDGVRRMTGGRALLHDDDLTYSFVAPTTGILRGMSVKGAYAAITGALRGALSDLGVPVDEPTPARGSPRAAESMPCLAVPTGHEVTSGGKKIIASAQRWKRFGVLQHGSILWSIDRELWRRLTRLGESALNAVGIREVLETPPSESALIRSLRDRFEDFLGAEPLELPLNALEQSRVRALERKYASAGWTRFRIPEGVRSRQVDNSEAVW